MKQKLLKTILLTLFSVCFSWSQTTEVFENESTGANGSFSEGGKTFLYSSLSGDAYRITSLAGLGWNGTSSDNKFIDNNTSAGTGDGTQLTIETNDGSEFTMTSFYAYIADGTGTGNGSGTLTVEGKKNGSQVFTFTKTSGFNSVPGNSSTQNGFTFINLATEGGSNNSNLNIDELSLTTTGTFDYLSIDAFKFGAAVVSNSAPVATAPTAPVVLEDATNVALADNIQIADSDGDDQTVTFTVTGGTLTLGTSGVTFGGSGNGSTSFTATGTLATINTALDAATFTPTANLNGTNAGTISFTTNDGEDTSNTASVTFDITAVNDEPSFTKGANEVVNEDAGAQTVTGWATALDDGDSDAVQTLTFTVTNNNNSLFSTQPAISATGNLTYTPAAGVSGVATVNVVLSDNGGTSNGGDDTFPTETFTITVNAVNDEPSFTKGANEVVNEDAGAQTVTGWATALDDGDSDAVQTLTFTVTNNNNSLFSTEPAISSTGNLTYTPTAGVSGVATVNVVFSDNGGTSNGGDDTFPTETFMITVNAVNDEPSFTKGANEVVNEDAGAQTVTGWATALDDGDSDAVQTLTFTVTNNNNGLFSTQPAISATGNLTYTPAAGVSGVATVNVVLSDNGGTSNGGDDTFPTETFMITVNAVNDEPSFTKGANEVVNEDAGAQTVTGWATALDDGDSDAVQTLTFTVTNNNNSLFSTQPAISATGNLTYTPAAGASGVATVSVVLSDNGGTSNGGDDTFPTETFTITLSAVNDEPSFTKGANEVVNEDAGAQTVTGWATALDDGDSDAVQILTFTVTNNNNSLFSTQPAISATGNLTYTPTANASGVATVSVVLSDNGGTSNGGDDTFPTEMFTITVNQVNDTPVVITSISDDNGSSASDYITNDNTPTVNGTAEPGSTITLLVNGTSSALFGATVTTNSMGVFEFPFPAAFGMLPDATATFLAAASLNGVTLTSSPQSVTIDTAAPAPTISSTESSPTASDPIAISVDWGENVTSFTASDIVVTNGTISNFTGSDDSYTFEIEPTANGEITVNIAEDLFADLAGNNNVAATEFSITYNGFTLSNDLISSDASIELENPVKDRLVITGAVNSVAVYSLSGVLVANSQDVSMLTSGIYVAVINTAKGVFVERIIKE